jgi:diguanylate cyclase (GGDEF)-like protein
LIPSPLALFPVYLFKPVETHDLVDWLDRLTQGISSKPLSKPYRILIVDDDRYLAESYALILQLAGMEARVLTEPLKILDIIADYHPDLILMDIYMPECNGIDLAQVVRQHRTYLSIPIVFLSVENNVERQLAAKRLGGDDFLTKPIEPSHLISAVLSRAERARDLRTVMESDSLTGLLNHVVIKERLAIELKRAHRQGTPLTFALIDLDHFKAINDDHGHLTGDRVIKALASLLNRRLRDTDIIGRYGGEEFAVILTETETESAVKVMNEIRKSFALLRHSSGEQEFSVTLSCGVAGLTDKTNSRELIAAADGALYAAKAAGRNRVVKA